jgi:biotin carboxyl carrier protein
VAAGLSVESLGDGWYLVSDGSRRWHVAVAHGGTGHWVFVDGLVTQVGEARNSTVRPRTKGAIETGMTAPMPATVVAIHVAPGATVQPGDTLIVLEAMKMELPLRSPRGGVIKSIYCAKGELVQPGVNLLEFE